MKKLIVIAMTAVLSVLVITVLAQTESGQEGGGATEKSAGGRESTQERYMRTVQEKRSEGRAERFYRRPRYRERGYDLQVGAVNVERPVSGRMQDIVNYLMQKDEQNTKRIEALEATVARLEADFKRNSGIERKHWSKVGDLEDRVKLLVRAERRRRRTEGATEEDGSEEMEVERKVESGEEHTVLEEEMEEQVGVME